MTPPVLTHKALALAACITQHTDLSPRSALDHALSQLLGNPPLSPREFADLELALRAHLVDPAPTTTPPHPPAPAPSKSQRRAQIRRLIEPTIRSRRVRIGSNYLTAAIAIIDDETRADEVSPADLLTPSSSRPLSDTRVRISNRLSTDLQLTNAQVGAILNRNPHYASWAKKRATTLP